MTTSLLGVGDLRQAARGLGVADVFANALSTFGDMPMERRLFGTIDPQTVAQLVDGFCQTELGSAISECRFVSGTQGSVWGLQLRDQRMVVIKVVDDDPLELEGIGVTQARLNRLGFCCPQPIFGPVAIGNGYAMVSEMSQAGEASASHDDALRRARAETLAWLCELLQSWPTDDRLVARWPAYARRVDPLWGKPHSPAFNFAATQAGAAWIEGWAVIALGEMSKAESPPQLGHHDWSAQNVRTENDAVVAVFDWESLCLAPLPYLVGSAAVTHAATWPNKPMWASPEEASSFVDFFEGAAEICFTRQDRAALRGAALYAMAYTARCEHAHDPSSSPEVGSFRHALRAWAPDYLLI